MSLHFEPLHPLIGAEVSGIDLREPVDEDRVSAINYAMAKFAVLVFREQDISADEHASFTRKFGPIDEGLSLATNKKSRLDNTDVLDLANVDENGDILPIDDPRNVSLIANQMWHSDVLSKTRQQNIQSPVG